LVFAIISMPAYADDTQIYIALTASDLAAELSRLSSCLSTLQNWFCHNGLALNSSKSESILFGTRQRLHSFPTVSSPTISGSTIQISDSIKILGVTLDNHLTLKQHVQFLCRNILFHTRALRHIRPALTDSMAATVAASVVQSRLDYANALLHGTLAGNIHAAVCTELIVSRCSASSPRPSQQQTLTSSLAPGMPAFSVQNRHPNIQELVNQPATIPQKSSSHVSTIALSPLSQSKSLTYSFLY